MNTAMDKSVYFIYLNLVFVAWKFLKNFSRKKKALEQEKRR